MPSVRGTLSLAAWQLLNKLLNGFGLAGFRADNQEPTDFSRGRSASQQSHRGGGRRPQWRQVEQSCLEGLAEGNSFDETLQVDVLIAQFRFG